MRLALLAMGFCATAAQLLILRELLVAFHGNELFLGVIFGNWLIFEAAGSWWAHRRADRASHPAARFALLQIAIGLACVLGILWIRSFKQFMGIDSGEVLGIAHVAWVSAAALAPLALMDGALFPFGCRALALSDKRGGGAARAYMLEALGAFAAGLLFVFYLIERLNPIELAGVILILSLCSALILLGATQSSRSLSAVTLALLAMCTLAIALGGARRLDEFSARILWHGHTLIETRNSVYANLAVIAEQGQYSFFANGAPYATTPAPEAPMQEIAHLPMLFHARPEQVLVIGGGAGGLLAELLKHPTLVRIDYAEPDPLVIETFRRFPTGLTEYELNHAKVVSRLVEGRRWLRETGTHYDLILVNLPIPATLQLNRYYTLEFFRLVQQRLKPGGILAVNLPGSETVLTPELKALNQTLHATLRGVFAHARIVAGDQNIFVASADPAIASVGPDQLVARLHARSITGGLISAPYLRYRTDPRRIASLERDIAASGQQPPNRDMHPRGVTQALAYLNSVVSPFMVGFLAAIEPVRLVHWLTAIAAATFLALHVQRGRRPRLFLGYAIATTGFASMLLYLLLIFSLQVHYGHVYHYIGLLTALFMLGSAGGAYLALRRAETSLLAIEWAILLFVGLVTLFTCLVATPPFAEYLIGALMFLAGFLTGWEYPVAVRQAADARASAAGATAGRFYALDLIGAFLGAIIATAVLVPTLGVSGALLVALALKAGSLLVVFAARPLAAGDWRLM